MTTQHYYRFIKPTLASIGLQRLCHAPPSELGVQLKNSLHAKANANHASLH